VAISTGKVHITKAWSGLLRWFHYETNDGNQSQTIIAVFLFF